jgi:hypothetical protein
MDIGLTHTHLKAHLASYKDVPIPKITRGGIDHIVAIDENMAKTVLVCPLQVRMQLAGSQKIDPQIS